MAIHVDTQPDETSSHDEDVITEEVFLGNEGPYAFRYPKMERIMNTHLRIKGLPKNKAEEEMVETMMAWLAKGFGSRAWAHIQSRLDDFDDVLRTEHLLDTFRLLIQARAGRPTTSSSDASAQPWMKTSTDVPSAEESDSEPWMSENSAT